jgi:hypothetical protein
MGEVLTKHDEGRTGSRCNIPLRCGKYKIIAKYITVDVAVNHSNDSVYTRSIGQKLKLN